MMTQKKIGLVAIATPAWFLMVCLVMSAMRPDYAHNGQAFSELGSLDAPNLWAWNVLGYILPGLAIALLGIGLRREFVGRGLRADGPATAVVATGLLMALSGAFPANMQDFKSTTTLLHTVGSFGCYIAFLVAGFWLPSLFRKVNSWRWAATPSLALVVASIITGFLRFAGMASIGQRITFLCFLLWIALVGWALWRASSLGARLNSNVGHHFRSSMRSPLFHVQATLLPVAHRARLIPGWRPTISPIVDSTGSIDTSATSLGIIFADGPGEAQVGSSFSCTFRLMAWPDPLCHSFTTGVEFAFLEGITVVGTGRIVAMDYEDSA